MKKTVVLDIDRTLVHSVEKYRINWEWKDRFEWFDIVSHITFLRPLVREFIDFLFKEDYNVGIFTAGERYYADEVVEYLFRDKKPSFILSNTEYEESLKLYGRMKPVEYIMRKYSLDECILIDDSNRIYNDNTDRCYRIKPFFVCFDDIPKFNVGCDKDIEFVECMRWLKENF